MVFSLWTNPFISFGVLFPESRVGWQEFERGYAADLLLPTLDLPVKRNLS